MSQSGFETSVYIAGIVKVMAEVILFLLLWKSFHKNRKDKMSMTPIVVLFIINIGLYLYPNTPPKGRLLISALLITLYSFIKEKNIVRKQFLFLLYFMDCIPLAISSAIVFTII